MKNLFYLLVFAFLFLQGCGKEESITRTQQADYQKIGKNSDIHMISFSGKEPLITISADEFRKTNMNNPDIMNYRTSNHHVNGHFSPYEGVAVTLSGMQNNGGIHGNGQVQSWFLDFKMESECITVDGNEAIYGGIISQVTYVDPDWIAVYGDVIFPGQHFVLKVVDNGEGQNAPPDKTAIYFSVGPVPLCDVFPLDSPYWSWQMIDVLGEADQIQIQ